MAFNEAVREAPALRTIASRSSLLLNPSALDKAPAEREFVKFLLSDLAKYVGYANLTTLPSMQYQEATRRVGFARRPLSSSLRGVEAALIHQAQVGIPE